MSIRLFRIDDRLIHGQVVVGWGQPLDARLLVLVDDEVCDSEWEQDLYRMGVPGELEILFASVPQAVAGLPAWQADSRTGILLTGDIETMVSLCDGSDLVDRVNVGGVHHRPGRTERLRYVYLTDQEAGQLRALGARGVEVTAQDVPTARAVPLKEFT